jgi:hypothetical protein
MRRSVAASTMWAVEGLQVERRVVDGGHQEGMAGLQGGAADDFVARAERHFIDADIGGGTGLAEAGLHAGQVLQFEDHVFEDVAGPGTVAQPFQEAAAFANAAAVFDQSGQPGGQAPVEAGKGVRRTFFEFADVEPGLDDRAVSPDVRATQMGNAKNLDVFLVCHEKFLCPAATSLSPRGVALCLCPASRATPPGSALLL